MIIWQLPIATILLFQIERWILILTVHKSTGAAMSELFFASLIGLRFDVMVAGYILLPVFVTIRLGIMRRVIFYYLHLCNVLAFFLSSLDMAHFLKYGDRVNQTTESESLRLALGQEGILLPTVALLIVHALAAFGIQKSIEIGNQHFKLKTQMLAVLFALLAMRGSLGSHHLDLRHSEITENKAVNALVIHSAYAWDQALRDRR